MSARIVPILFNRKSALASLFLANLSMDNNKKHHAHGHYINPWDSFRPTHFSDMIKMVWTLDRSRSAPPSQQDCDAMVDPVDLVVLNQPVGPNQMRLTWLGHASFLLQLPGNIGILFDPIFSNRCSPVQFAGPQRYTKPPCKLADIRHLVDMVVISHNHYDHLDLNTLLELRPETIYFVPLGNKQWILNNVNTQATVYECDWWDEHEVKGLKIACTPCQHFTGRSLTDRFKTLWASWVIIEPSSGARYYFAGDTGYRAVSDGQDPDKVPHCPAFKEIGQRYGPFHLASIPIGAYSPRWFMSPIHCNPYDAVCLHKDINARKSIGMHFGTFVLTDEPVLEPPKMLKEALEHYGVPQNEFTTLKIGHTITVDV
jgi:N-acyl-phosphatidylethanolamine-hydrolysing phospholipase D